MIFTQVVVDALDFFPFFVNTGSSGREEEE
jgi:hypothetical protein